MKKTILFLFISIMFLAVMTACNGNGDEAGTEDNSEAIGNNNNDTIVFGLTTWTSTEAPTNIAKLILEEAGFNVEFIAVDQPVIFKGMAEKEVDFFMDAWLPYTEAVLWSKYEDDLQMVTASYEDVPLGWVVPSYVQENTIEELIGNGDKFDNRVITIAPGAGIVSLSHDVIADYGLDEFQLMTSSEIAMIAELERKYANNEPIIITGWRPHSKFAQYDLKFLEDTRGHFLPDNVYVVSYQGIENEKPEAYEILSNWSIEVADLEEMMLAHEENGTSFEVLAEQWIANNRDKVDMMLGK